MSRYDGVILDPGACASSQPSGARVLPCAVNDALASLDDELCMLM